MVARAGWIDRTAGACHTAIGAALVVATGWIARANADETPPPSNEPPAPAVTPVSATAPASATATPPATASSVRFVLAYKFQPGQFVNYSGTTRVQYTTQLGDQYKTPAGVTQSLEGRTFHTRQSTETGSHFRVVTVDEKGLASIEPVIDRTRMTAKMHDKDEVVYDSTSKLLPPQQFQAVRESIGRTVARFQVAPDGKLVKAVIVDPTAPQSLRDAALSLTTRFSCLSPLPATPVSVGDKWREDYSVTVLNEGLKQPLPMRRIYELTAVADGIAVIKFRTVVLTPLNDPEVEKQIIQQTPTGSIEFDLERGLVRSYKSSINRTTINAFGPQSLLRVTGESTETLVTADPAATANPEATTDPKADVAPEATADPEASSTATP
jgi:hypothetical protein